MHPVEFQSETLAQNRIPSNEKLIRKIDTLSTPSQGHITFNISFYIFCVWNIVLTVYQEKEDDHIKTSYNL